MVCSIEEIVKSSLARENSGEYLSDIHIKSDGTVFNRINGQITKSNNNKISKYDLVNSIDSLTNLTEKERINKFGSVDISKEIQGCRLRMNIYSADNGYNIAIRKLNNRPVSLKSLGIFDVVNKEIHKSSGIILITGKTGSGKSTTMNSIINEINTKCSKHIITLEDPIEFIYKNDKSIVTQIEVNKDVSSFSDAVVASLRQDPDIIVIGEMRDRETMKAALTASETGHLIISTLHTNSAAESIDRIIESFDSSEQNQIRYLLSRNINMIISQELEYNESKKTRNAIFEIMVTNDAIRNMIRQCKTYQIDNEIASGRKLGMMTKEKSRFNINNLENHIYNNVSSTK